MASYTMDGPLPEFQNRSKEIFFILMNSLKGNFEKQSIRNELMLKISAFGGPPPQEVKFAKLISTGSGPKCFLARNQVSSTLVER